MLAKEYYYAWIGLRLARGTAGIPELQRHLAALSAELQRQERKATHRSVSGLSFSVNRSDVIRSQVQQAIRPEAVALSVFGAIAALAMLVLAGQGLAQMISRSAPDIAVIRALGASRAQATQTAALPGLIPILGGTLLAVAGAVAVSPLAPVGPVRRFDPNRGFEAGRLVLRCGRVRPLCRLARPVVEIPVPALVLGLAALVVAGNLLAAVPAAIAGRTLPSAGLRAE